MAQHNETGNWGERVAQEYLISKGFAIMAQNQRVGHKEIDIIALKDDIVAFVEVKTRTTDFNDPLDAVDERKIRLLTRAADRFIQSNDLIQEPQFDIITIIGTPDNYRLTHYPDAFLPPLSSY